MTKMNESADNQSGLRRSSRKRISTTVRIQGYEVKALNNYDVTASSYVMGTYQDDPQIKKKPKTATIANSAAALSNKAPRKPSQAESNRTKHNENVRKSIETKQSARIDFLAKHRDVLDPFMDEHTRDSLQKWSEQKNPHIPYQKEELYIQPELIEGGEMRDYQLAGLNFLVDLHRQNIGQILGDEMGLGKTLQTISLLAHLKERDNNIGPSLVVCPLSVLYSWCSEIKRWAPSFRVLRLHSPNPEEQEIQRKELAEHGADKYDVIVTTYEMVKVKKLMGTWARLYFRYLVLDEGHKIKGRNTEIAHCVRKIHSENRLLLTGTPLQNDLSELVNLLNFLLPDIFTNFKPFDDAFDISHNRVDQVKMIQAQKVLDLFMIRRLKEQVERLLPKKLETKVYCPMSKQQVFWYKNLLMKDINSLTKVEDGKVDSSSAEAAKKLKSLFMQLRKATIHPFLFHGAEPDIGKTTVTELIAASGKLAVLDSLLRKLLMRRHRVCLFSQFTTALDIIADYCAMRGWKYCSFDGRTSRAKRNYLINSFNAPDSPYFLFLMSTRSGGLGTNLQSADTVVLFDSDWNPQSDLQAIARCHRIGQKKTVHVYRLISGGTIEERILQRAEKKLLLDQMVNRGQALGIESENGASAGLSAVELLKDIKFGSAAVFGDSSLNTLPTDKELDDIINRSRTEECSTGSLKGNAFHRAVTYDVNHELSASQTFEGIDFKKIREEQKREEQRELPETMKGIAHLWREISQLEDKRQKKNRIVMVSGDGSGYGKAYIPVLASNNYDISKGESSVFDRELSTVARQSYTVAKKTKNKSSFEHQQWCQICGDGGLLYLCSRCPISVHKTCCRHITVKGEFSCGHHWCVQCGKSALHAGGLLYPCQSCPNVFCEDCLSVAKQNKGFRILGECERFEKLGFNSTKQNVYIHCSDYCESYAKKVWDWNPPRKRDLKQACPEPLDVSYNFGSSVISKKDYEAFDDRKTAASSVPMYGLGTSDIDAPTLCATTAGSSANSEISSDVAEYVT